MFGAGIPVCAVGYPALSELVNQDINGVIFKNSFDLCEQLFSLLYKDIFKRNSNKQLTLLNMKKNVLEGDLGCWEDNWNNCMLPVVEECIAMHKSHRKSALYIIEVSVIFILAVISVVFVVSSIKYTDGLVK
jgi:hypothetical protein